MSASARTALHDVLVLGAGSVGLATALMLARQGLDVRVIDRRPPQPWLPPPGFDARVYALNPAVRRRLQALGVWDALDARRIGVIAAMEVHGDAGGRLHFGDGQQPLAHVVEGGALQSALMTALDARNGRGWWHAGEPAGVRIDGQAAWLDCAAAGTPGARLLVGADGARSWLRQALGWPEQVRDYQRQGVVANFRCARPHGNVARQWFSAGEVIALLPLGGDHVSLVWSAHDALARTLVAGPPGDCARALAGRIGEPLGTLEEISAPQAFPLRLVRVPRISDARVALVGDAAHGVHPLAGQGLNLGLADAACLADVLAARGGGPDPGDAAVLRRYARQRAEPTFAMQSVTDGLHRLFDAPGPLARLLRNRGLDLVDRLPLLKTLLAAGAAGQDPDLSSNA